MTNLKTKFQQVCMDYSGAFMRKHGFFDEENGEYYDYSMDRIKILNNTHNFGAVRVN